MNKEAEGSTIYAQMLMAEKTGENDDNRLNHNGDCLKRLTFDNVITKDRYFEQDTYSWPHASPGSVTVIAVGNRWKRDDDGDCERMVRDMCYFAQNQGYKVLFEEIAVWYGVFPNPSVASAREAGGLTARSFGTEYIFYCDNDIKPQKELLSNLLQYNVPMIVPMVMDQNKSSMIGGPIREKDSGIYNQKWASMSALLMKTCLLDLPGVKFSDADTEGLFYQRIARWGHTIHIDTSQVLTTVTPPTRPDSKTYDEREQMNKDRYAAIFEKRVPMDAVAQELFDEAKKTGQDQVKVM